MKNITASATERDNGILLNSKMTPKPQPHRYQKHAIEDMKHAANMCVHVCNWLSPAAALNPRSVCRCRRFAK